MPPGGALPPASITTIRQWITDGAIDDRVVVQAPIRVSSLSPMPNADLQAAPTQIVAGFDRDLDASTVNTTTFTLQASGGDGTFADGNEVQVTPASVTVPAMNPQSAVMDLNGVTLNDDTYRVLLLGTGGSMIMDLDSNALDGEFSGAFPSGNGTAGGTFVAQFSIATPVTIGPTLAQIQAVVFTPSCATSTCHTGPMPAANLDLSNEATSYAQLVGVASTQQAAILRVAASDPDNSYLVMKLEGAAGITGTMMPPPTRPTLDPSYVPEIRNWITNGAQP